MKSRKYYRITGWVILVVAFVALFLTAQQYSLNQEAFSDTGLGGISFSSAIDDKRGAELQDALWGEFFILGGTTVLLFALSLVSFIRGSK